MCSTEPWQEHVEAKPLQSSWVDEGSVSETYQSCRAWKGSIYWLLNFRRMDENMLHNFQTLYMMSLRPTSETSLQAYISTALVEWAVCIVRNSVWLWCTAMWSAKRHRQIGTETWSENLMVGARLEYMLGVWHPHRLSFRMWYGSSACLPCVAFLCLHSIYAHPRIALLFPTSLHFTICNKQTLVVHIIPCVPFLSSIPLFGHCPYWLTLVVLAVHRES